MGVKIDQFDLPICNKFKPIILRDQLCYQVDVNEFKDAVDVHKNMKNGLMFVMDYNKEKMSAEYQ